MSENRYSGVNGSLAILIISSFLFVARLGETSIYLFDYLYLAFFCIYRVSLPRSFYAFALAFIAWGGVGVIVGVMWGGMEFEVRSAISSTLRYVHFMHAICAFPALARLTRISPSVVVGASMVGFLIPLAYHFVGWMLFREAVLVFNRGASYLGNPNTFGAFICSGFWLVMVLPKVKPGPFLLIGKVATFAFVVFALYSAGSHSYWILVAVAGGLVIAYRIVRIPGKGATLLVLSGCLLAVVLVVGSDWQDKNSVGFDRTEQLVKAITEGEGVLSLGSGSFRILTIEETLAHVAENPWILVTGVGLGQSASLLSQYMGMPVSPHVMGVTLVFECGLVGAMMLVVFMVGRVRGAQKAHFVVIGLIGYVLASFGTPHLYLPFFWMPVVVGALLDEGESELDKEGSMGRAIEGVGLKASSPVCLCIEHQ